MAGFLWSVPINTRIQKSVSVFEERTWSQQHMEAFSESQVFIFKNENSHLLADFIDDRSRTQ